MDAELKGQSLPLAHFRFEEKGVDALGNSPAMEISNASFVEGTLGLFDGGETGFYITDARIPDLSYEGFTVAVDFKDDRDNSSLDDGRNEIQK